MERKKRSIEVKIDESLLAFLITSVGNPQAINGFSPLCWAAKNSSSFIVNLLIEGGADISKDGYQALLEAISEGNIDIVQLLIKKGVSVTGDKNKAIVVAAKNGHINIVKLLLDYGADVNSYNNRALYSACENNHLEVAKILIENGCNSEDSIVFALDKAILNGYAELAEYILQFLPLHINNYPILKSAFNRAITNNYVDVVKLLIEKGIDVNNVISGSAPIVYATASDSIECAKLLIDADANVTYDTYRALKISCKNDNSELFDMLIKKITVK